MDALDLKIIEVLQRNGRVKNAELASQCGVAPSTMLERVRKLEDSKIVQGYLSDINLKRLGLMIHGFVAISLTLHTLGDIDSFEKRIQKIPYVRACFRVTGRFDYFVHVTARDLDHYGDLVKKQFAAIPGIGKMETFFIMEEVKRFETWTLAGCLTKNEEGKENDQ